MMRHAWITQGGAVSVAQHYSHDCVFHSVMGALGMRSEIYNKQLDIFNNE